MSRENRPRNGPGRGPKSRNPCPGWMRDGTCKFGNGCRYSHENSWSRKVCIQWMQDGACRYGDSCKFSHEPSSQSSTTVSSSRAQAGQGNDNRQRDPTIGGGGGRNTVRNTGMLTEWTRLLHQGSNINNPNRGVVQKFFALAVGLMDHDLGATQETIRMFATDEGLFFVKTSIEHHIPLAVNPSSRTALWKSEINPLFQIVTHPRVTMSAVLEQPVSIIFNFLYGVGGVRMSRLFTFVSAFIDDGTDQVDANSSCVSTIMLSLHVLSKLLECNSAAIVNEAFQNIATKIADSLALIPSTDENEFRRRQANKSLDFIRRRLSVGDEIPLFQGDLRPPVAHESFVLRQDLPGHLSAEGPRHDNDHANICYIKIMPTMDEIKSPRAEYLPTTDSSQWHIGGVRGLLDRVFRLLREDSVGQLRDAVRATQEWIQSSQGEWTSQLSTKGALTYTYKDSMPIDLQFLKDGGMELMVQCRQPPQVDKKNTKKRCEWWTRSKRLLGGALVCILHTSGSVLFCVVSESTLRTADDKPRGELRAPNQKDMDKPSVKLSLADHKEYIYVKLRLVDADSDQIREALKWRYGGVSDKCYLVEFPGVLLASFKETLEALKKMYEMYDMPFADLIAPSSGQGALEMRIPPPAYATRPGFDFDLRCLTSDGEPFRATVHQLPSPDAVAARTCLDPTQSVALLNTLSRSLSLIQGPPGTGKSYTGEKIIKTILANRGKGQLGPILCMCYTNHALDQLLEHLLDDNIKGIIRIGSRSKSERLELKNLRVVSQNATRTKAEKRAIWVKESELDAQIKELGDLNARLAASRSWRIVKAFLAEENPDQHHELFGADQAEEEGFTTVRQPEKIIGRWLHDDTSPKHCNNRPLETLKVSPLCSMSQAERAKIYQHWQRRIHSLAASQIASCFRRYACTREERNRARRDVDLRCLNEADVVGVTATGLARNLDLLRKLRCQVLLCEEAGEVLEAHVLTALLPSLEHVILIGDHQQLRPQIQDYELQMASPRGIKYSHDMSLFERLVAPPHDADIRVPFSTLTTQRRMHPSISKLIMPLYPSLEDALNVGEYPGVVGMKRRLFWFDHDRLEASASSEEPNTTSHSNDFEVEFTAALVSHLVRQGKYSHGDIAVITPYLGQLHKLRQRMQSMFEICIGDQDQEDLDAQVMAEQPQEHDPFDMSTQRLGKSTLLKQVRIATVDNFQGEEAKVVVISLVRSNAQSKCGFLSTSNRINVLLSRAKHGMYIIGNSRTYSHVSMWAEVIDKLRADGNIGTNLELQCPRHLDTPLLVTEPDHFVQMAPESGCTLPCDRRLRCGHKCGGRCHSDMLHSAFKCLEKCPRLIKGCAHGCPLACGDTCPKLCLVRLEDTPLVLECGHTVRSASCCEHQNPPLVVCQEIVERKVPGCGHVIKVKCHENVDSADFRCLATCGYARACGHTCRRQCCSCRTRESGRVTREAHGECLQNCGRGYQTCRHTCTKRCHDGSPCGLCEAPCEVRCGHSKCNKLCHEPCAPCAEKDCESKCPHRNCTMPCGAPCDWVPCSKRCESGLTCGHQCPSVCGERCPDVEYCQECSSEEIKATVVDMLEMKIYLEVDLNEDPCIFPDCGHFLTQASMDGMMIMQAHYHLDEEGRPSSLKKASEPFSMTEIKVCAACRGSLRNLRRYGRIVRRAMLDEATKKFISWSQAECLELEGKLLDAQEVLSKDESTTVVASHRSMLTTDVLVIRHRLEGLFNSLKKSPYSSRYRQIFRLRKEIVKYRGLVRREEQPFERVAHFVNHARREYHKGQGEFHYDQSVIQARSGLLAGALLLRCDVAILSDWMKLREKQSPAAQVQTDGVPLKSHLESCTALITQARDASCPRQQVLGHIYYAKFCTFARMLVSQAQAGDPQSPGSVNYHEARPKVDGEEMEKLRAEAVSHIEQARGVVKAYSSAKNLEPEIEAAARMVDGGVHYQEISLAEMRAVYLAMEGEFSGTGHWYTCAAGHPFTVGECGMPMERARCPECGAPVGGAEHTPAEGVRHALEIEALGRSIEGLRF